MDKLVAAEEIAVHAAQMQLVDVSILFPKCVKALKCIFKVNIKQVANEWEPRRARNDFKLHRCDGERQDAEVDCCEIAFRIQGK